MSVKTSFQDLQEFGWTKPEVLARAQALRGNSAEDVHLNDHKVSHEYNWSVHNALKGEPVAVATRPILTTKITHTHFYDNSANANGVTLSREETWEHEEVNVVNVTSHAHVLLKESVSIAGVKVGLEATQPASSKKVTPETASYQVHVAAGESVEWTVVKTITGTLTVWEQTYGPEGHITTIGGRYQGHYYHGYDVDHLLDTPRGKLQLQSLSTKSDNDILIKNKIGPVTKSHIVITHIVPHAPALRVLSDYLVSHDLRATLPSRVTWATKASPIVSVGRVVLTPPAPPPPVKHPQVRYTARAHIGSPNILAIGRSLAATLRSHGYSNTSSHVDAVHCTATFTILLPNGKTANDAETLFRTVLKDVKDARFLEAHAVKILVVHADGFEDVEDIERHSSEWEHFHSGVKNQHQIHYDLPLVKYTGKATFPTSRVLSDVAKQMTHLLAHRGYNETKPAIDAKNHAITYVITVPVGKTAAETDVAYKSVVSVWEHARVAKSSSVKLFGILEDGFQETSDIDIDSYDWNNFRSGAPPQHHHALKYEGKASFSSHTALEHAPTAITRYLATQGYLTASTPAIDQKHLTASFVILAPGGKSALDAENTFIHSLTLDSAPKSQHGEFIRGIAHKQIGSGTEEVYEELDRDADEWVYFRSGETHAEQNRHSRSLAASSASIFTQNNVLTLKYTAKASFPASAGSLSALALLVTRTLTARGFTSPITSSIDTRHNTATFVVTLPNGKTIREAETAFKSTVDRDTIGGTWVHGSAVKVFVNGSNGEECEEIEDVIKGTDEWDTLVGF